MSDEKQRVLNSYRKCQTRLEADQWEGQIAAELVEMAEPLPRESSYSSERAYCPLCGAGTTWGYESGYSLPEGLLRHLTGWGSNVRQCSVMTVAFKLAQGYWDREFNEAEQQEASRRMTLLAKRRQSETLYAIAPDQDAVLIDEGLGFGDVARGEEEIVWAEERLMTLGFRLDVQGVVKSYVDEQEGYIVYADPRKKGCVTFRVYRKPFPKKSRTPRVRLRALHFNLPDSWKNGLPAKYRQHVVEVLRESRGD